MKVRLDFVTNSSSSCFVCSTSKTPEEVKEILDKMIELLNMQVNYSYDFEDVFEYPFIGDGSELDGWGFSVNTKDKLIINSAGDNTIPYSLFDLIEDTFEGERLHLG